MLAEFHFLRPYWFIALLPLAWLLWRQARRQLVNKHWENVCDPKLLPYILVGKSATKSWLQISLLGIAALLAIIALAGPSWEKLPQPVFQKESALVIALDLSYSMYADDIKPSRLERARFKISDLLDIRKEGQTALIVYAGDAFTVTPLTDDTKTIKSQLSALSPDIMPAPGSNTTIAIDKAIELLKQSGNSQGHILLATDEVTTEYEAAFTDASSQGYAVSILSIGTTEGAPIKTSDGGFLKDRAGTIVIPKLDKDTLRKLSNAGGGRYQDSQISDADIERLNRYFNKGREKNEETQTEFDTDQWREAGPWLILLIIPIMALSFRRGYLGVLLCIMLINPDPAMAFEWRSLWLNKDQQAKRALDQEQNELASDLFENKDWKAAAKYQAGDYAATEEILAEQNDTRSLYNKGNAMARQGRYEDALAAYDEVLKQNPQHNDAKYNKELIEKELEKQQQNQQQSQSDSGSEQQDSGQQQSQQSDQNNSEQSEQQQSESDASQQQQDQEMQQQSQSSQQQDDTESEQANAQQQENALEETKQQAEQTEQNKAEEQADEKKDEQAQQLAQQQTENEIDEQQQASEQWLRRIPDDPAGLLRRKFKYQYQQQNRQATSDKYW